jgi:hypothetical protein
MKLTTRQRQALHKRIALALCWHAAPAMYRNDAILSATHVLDALEDAQFSAMALRRGVEAVIKSVDRDEVAS